MLTNSVRKYATKFNKKLYPLLNRFRCSQIQWGFMLQNSVSNYAQFWIGLPLLSNYLTPLNSTIFQHPDQKPGCRKFWRLSGFARSKRVGCVTCIWESYMEFSSLTIHLIHDVHASALWRSIRIFSFFSTLFVIEEVECVFTSFFQVKLLHVELWVSLNTLHLKKN